MNSNTEILHYWGENNLRRVNKNAVETLKLSAATSNYLVNVGVPRSSELIEDALGVSFDFVESDRIIALSLYFNDSLEENDISDSLGCWMLLGRCYDKFICVNFDDDSIVIIEGDPESGFMDWYVNSSIDKYMLFITKAAKAFERPMKAATVAQSLDALRQLLAEMDPEAMRKKTHWWPIVLGDIQNMS